MTAEFLRDLAEEEPDAIPFASKIARPDDAFVPEGAEFAWTAFWALQGDRPMTVTGYAAPMGGMMMMPKPGRIPFSAMDRYARRLGIEGSAFDLLQELVAPLDRAYLEWDEERSRERARAAG